MSNGSPNQSGTTLSRLCGNPAESVINRFHVLAQRNARTLREPGVGEKYLNPKLLDGTSLIQKRPQPARFYPASAPGMLRIMGVSILDGNSGSFVVRGFDSRLANFHIHPDRLGEFPDGGDRFAFVSVALQFKRFGSGGKQVGEFLF